MKTIKGFGLVRVLLVALFFAGTPIAAAANAGATTTAHMTTISHVASTSQLQRLSVSHASTAAVIASINSVRKKFKLPVGRATTIFQAEVNAAARGLRDPPLNTRPKGVVEQLGLWGVLASSDGTGLDPTSLVDAWVYHDGWNGADTENVDCTSPGAKACNDHRRNVLSAAPAKGAKLVIDVAVVSTTVQGSPAVSVAAVLAWSV